MFFKKELTDKQKQDIINRAKNISGWLSEVMQFLKSWYSQKKRMKYGINVIQYNQEAVAIKQKLLSHAHCLNIAVSLLETYGLKEQYVESIKEFNGLLDTEMKKEKNMVERGKEGLN